ncbi:MAG: cation transporter [Kyrpidia tusciae]|nr:cation diffusion facilitator family transporter [Kyrpidia tusciae]MBE3552516.1 cation transporter [Kyrpidia tusciae]
MGFGHGHSHHHVGGHSHSHGGVDSSIVQDKEATRVLMISFVGLLVTGIVQAAFVALSGSVALLADTIHNFGDAFTSIPLWFAFILSRRLPTKRFPYGLNRTEDIAGLFIVLVILVSAVVAAYESVLKLIHSSSINHLGVVALAAVIGFLGNEMVAVYRIHMGKKIGSAALIADGHHARVDGLTSLAVLIGVVGAWLGYPIVDPIVGLGITLMILLIVKDSAKTVFTRIIDGIEPETIDAMAASAADVPGVLKVNDVKARWFGHEVLAEMSIAVNSDLSVKDAHQIAKNVIHRLQHDIDHLSAVQVHVDPVEEQGESFHYQESFRGHHGQDHDHGHDHQHRLVRRHTRIHS